MVAKQRKRLRGIAQPILVREPLIVRLCTALVDNLTLILRTAFVIASLFLVQELQPRFESADEPVAETQPETDAPEMPRSDPEPQESFLTDGVQHAFNCTFEKYRNAHYDECVNGESRIYQEPAASEDDSGHVYYASPEMFARLDNRSGVDQAPD